MNVALWIVAGLLAAAFLYAGTLKFARSRPELLAGGQRWVEAYSSREIETIGVLEVLGATGLLLPAAVHVAPVLVPIAATCLAVDMTGATIVHLRRREYTNIIPTLILLAGCVFVAWGRFGSYSF